MNSYFGYSDGDGSYIPLMSPKLLISAHITYIMSLLLFQKFNANDCTASWFSAQFTPYKKNQP